jgi:hypothetical protein
MTDNSDTTTVDMSSDIAWGAAEIGEAIRKTEREAYHLLHGGHLDGVARKIGGRWCASRRKLQAFVTGDLPTV